MDHATIALYNRIFLALFFVFVALFYTVLILVKQSKTTHKIVHKGRRFSLHWFNHLIFGIFRATIFTVCIVRVFTPGIDKWLITIESHWSITLLGQALMILGFGFAMQASVGLKNAWRSGIDTTYTQPLVTTGMYRISRNPNFLGVQVAQLGFFLALPSVFTAICLACGWACIRVQVRLEEVQLTKQYQHRYIHYIQSTPRWLSIKWTST